MCKDMTMDIFDLGSTLIDKREIYHLFLENCLEVVCRAGHALSLEKLGGQDDSFSFGKYNQEIPAFPCGYMLEKVSDLLKIL